MAEFYCKRFLYSFSVINIGIAGLFVKCVKVTSSLIFLTFLLLNEVYGGGYLTSAVTQISTATSAGATNQELLRISVSATTGSGSCDVTQMLFTMQNTNNADVTKATLYYTATSATFSTTTSKGFVNNPTGTITIPIAGVTGLSNTTVYFWLAFDINAAATVCTNYIDAFVPANGITITGTGAGNKTPTTNDPSGNRQIAGVGCWNYCASTGTSNTAGYITRVQFNTIDRSSGWDNGYYDATATSTSVSRCATVDLTITRYNASTYILFTAAWIDFNNNGLFTDAGENVITSSSTTTAGNESRTVAVTIPATAYLGSTRMRVMMRYNTAITGSCDNTTFLETEDYSVNITAGSTMSYVSSSTVQNISAVSVNSTNNQVIGIQINTSGSCSPLAATSFTFGTGGTTALSDISNAKLFYTGNSSTFSTSTQLGSTTAPAASFSINGFSQNLLEGTNYLWLTFDVSATAVVGNFIDAACSSFILSGSTKNPSPTSPTGNREIVGTPPAFCAITGGSSSSTPPYVNNVTFNGMSNLNTGQTGAATYYNNYFSSKSTTVGVNGLYDFSADANVAAAGCCYETTYLQVFIDMNCDGDFSDAGETVAQASGVGETGDRNVHIREAISFWGATSGISRMRVVASTGGYFGPCGTNADAEIEDYKIYIDPLTSHCYNTVLDGASGETTVDCGGADCGPYSTISITPSSAACGSGTFTLSASNTLSKGEDFQWQYSLDNSTWYDLEGATSLVYTGTSYNAITYYRAEVPGGNCATYYTPSVSLTLTGGATYYWRTSGATTSFTTNTNWWTTPGGPANPATAPNSACDNIFIQSSNAYPVISAATSCGNLNIANGTQITVNADLKVYGSLINDGNINDAGGSISLYGTANTWGGTGTFLNGVTQWGDIRIMDGANYILTSSPTVYTMNFNGGSIVSDGHLSLQSNTLHVTGAWYCSFYTHFNTGILDLQGGGSIDVSKSDYGTGTLWINSSTNGFTFDLEDDYYNVWFSNSAGTTKFGSSAVSVTIRGDNWIKSGTLDNSQSGSNTIFIGGDWINDGNYIASTATINMNGTAEQEIKGSSSTTFNKLTISNSSSAGVVLQTATSVSGTLTLTSGPLFLNSKTLTVTNAATTAMVRTSGYAVSETNSATNTSKLQWNIGATTGAHVFPFGTTAGDYIPITFNNSGNVGNIAISTRATTTNDNSPWPLSVSSMDGAGTNVTSAADRWWEITSSLANPLPSVNLTFSYTGAENSTTTNPTENRGIQHWNSTSSCWDNGKNGGCGSVSSSTDAGVTSGVGSVSVTGITYFSPFIVVRAASPLPVELLYFNAEPRENSVSLRWKTAVEVNNDYFIIEKSTDGMHFEEVALIKSKAKGGNSSINLEYEMMDDNPFTGISFYRLVQKDFDGRTSISDHVAVKFQQNGKFRVFPNPANEILNIISDEQRTLNIVIYDITGRTVKQSTVCGNLEFICKIDVSDLPIGPYYLSIYEADGEEKFISFFKK